MCCARRWRPLVRTPRNGSGSGTGSVGQWRHQYECGGLAAVLHVGHAPGRASSLPAEVIAGMRAKLAEPTGCASFHEWWRSRRTDLSSAHDLLRDVVNSGMPQHCLRITTSPDDSHNLSAHHALNLAGRVPLPELLPGLSSQQSTYLTPCASS